MNRRKCVTCKRLRGTLSDDAQGRDKNSGSLPSMLSSSKEVFCEFAISLLSTSAALTLPNSVSSFTNATTSWVDKQYLQCWHFHPVVLSLTAMTGPFSGHWEHTKHRVRSRAFLAHRSQLQINSYLSFNTICRRGVGVYRKRW